MSELTLSVLDQSPICEGRSARDAFEIYRARFKPSSIVSEPLVNLGVFVICADSTEEARALARCRDLWRLRFESGTFTAMPSLEESPAYEFSEEEALRIQQWAQQTLQGTSNEVYDQLIRLAMKHEVSEVVVLSVTPSYHQRMRCYELLAHAFDLRVETGILAQVSDSTSEA